MYTVIGATGFIGSRLAAVLAEQGAPLFLPARGDAALFARDLGTVFYCAGLTADYLKRPHETAEAHVCLLNRVLATGRFERIVYLSSTRLYDSAGVELATERTPLVLEPQNPRHLYDLTKGCGESLCLASGKGVVARLACVYGDDPLATGFVPQLLRRMKTERRLAVDSDAGFVRDYVAVEDVVAALMAMAGPQAQGIYNVASGENVANAEIGAALRAHGYELEFARHGARQTLPRIDVTRLRQELGVSPVGLARWLAGYTGRLACS